MAFISINVYNDGDLIRWRMASVRPASRVREGIYVWERRGEVQLDSPLPVTTEAMLRACLLELLAKLSHHRDDG